MDKILNSLVYRTLLCVNIYGSYKLLNTVRFFWPTLYIIYHIILYYYITIIIIIIVVVVHFVLIWFTFQDASV